MQHNNKVNDEKPPAQGGGKEQACAAGGGITVPGKQKILDPLMLEKLRQLAGDRFDAILKSFTENITKHIMAIESLAEQQDMEALQRTTHLVKGSSAQFGALRLCRIATEMEACAKRGDLTAIQTMYSDLVQARQDVLVSLKQYIDPGQAENG